VKWNFILQQSLCFHLLTTANIRGERKMNWESIEGNWTEFKGKAKAQWGKLTDDDLTVIEGNREALEGRLQSHYGYAKDKVRSEIDDWLGRI
jgi:uncharacterized protein YjbJ (UPF0337 family)